MQQCIIYPVTSIVCTLYMLVTDDAEWCCGPNDGGLNHFGPRYLGGRRPEIMDPGVLKLMAWRGA